MIEIPFYKYQGTGNDFIIINDTGMLPELSTEATAFLCNRRFGVGADGLMILKQRHGFDFEMVYYNADGREGSMCGNGGRCIARYYYDEWTAGTEINFLATDGPHTAIVDGETVRLKMQDVQQVNYAEGYATLNTGSPHYITFADKVEAEDVYAKGKAIRNTPAFEAEGINVNFVEKLSGDHIYVRTYERGVEDETYSCGTGVTAAALVSADDKPGPYNIAVQTKGGNLSIQFDKLSKTHFTNIWLCGPAACVFTGLIKL